MSKKCKVCGSPYVVNKFFCLCKKCNNIRLHGSEYGKTYSMKPSKSSIERTQAKINKDEEFYEECFNLSNHVCEECGKPLNTVFRDDEGKVACRWRYAHRWPKSVYPEWRHKTWNIMHLCLDHHTQYDHGDNKDMKVHKTNLLLKEKHKKFAR